jgi:O-antigen ligase
MKEKPPAFFLLAAIIVLPFSEARFFAFGVPVYMPELLCIFATLTFLWRKRYRDTLPLRKTPRSVIFTVSLIVAGLAVSLAYSSDIRAGLGIAKAWFFFPALFGWLVFQAVRSARQTETFFLAWYLGVVGVALVGLGYAFADTLTYDGRLRAFYLSPNYLAMFVTPGAFLGWHFLKRTFLFSRNRLAVAAILLSWLAVLWTLYLTLSYAAWIAVMAGFGLTFLWQTRFRRRTALLALAACATALSILAFSQYGNPKLQDWVRLSERSSLASRVMIWKAARAMLRDHPLAGIGPGNFQAAYLEYQRYFPPYLEWAVPQPHSLYLAFWLQTGLPGLAGFLSLVFLWFWKLFETVRCSDKKTASLAATLFGAMIALLTHGLLDTPYWKTDLAYSFWLPIALGFSLSFLKKETETPV